MKTFSKKIKKEINEKKNRSTYVKKFLDFVTENKLILLILLFSILFLKTYSDSGYTVPILDEGVYVGMGKSMFSSGESGFWERFRPIGVPIITGIAWSLDFNSYDFSKFIMILFSIASIFFVYLIAKKLFDKKIAVIGSIIFAITPLFVYYSGHVLTEIPSMLFILIGIYALLYDRYFVAGIMAGIGFTFKFTQGIFLIAIGLFLLITLFKSKNIDKNSFKFSNRFKKVITQGIFLTLGFVLAITPYLVFNYMMYHPYTNNLYDATLAPIVSATIFQDNQYQNLVTNTFGERVYGWFYYLINLILIKKFTSLLYIFFFVYLYLFFKQKMYNKNEHILLILIFVTYLSYFTSIPYKQERFVYFLIPIAAVYAAYALVETYDWVKEIDKKIRKNVFRILFIFIVVTFMILSVYRDVSFYKWKYASKPAVVTEMYEYYANNNITGTIATGDMVLAVYVDNKLTNMLELRAELEGKNDLTIDAIFHADYTYPCLDDVCIEDRTMFLNKISERYDLIKNESCYSGNCYIYLKK
jgi:4-amino-4-deoxy-L-arabinose transferase-like glycosyltransferase